MPCPFSCRRQYGLYFAATSCSSSASDQETLTHIPRGRWACGSGLLPSSMHSVSTRMRRRGRPRGGQLSWTSSDSVRLVWALDRFSHSVQTMFRRNSNFSRSTCSLCVSKCSWYSLRTRYMSSRTQIQSIHYSHPPVPRLCHYPLARRSHLNPRKPGRPHHAHTSWK